MKYGLKSDRLESARETCTACAGSMILEMAALSRITGEPVFELKAQKAMDELWKMRHRSSDLMGKYYINYKLLIINNVCFVGPL